MAQLPPAAQRLLHTSLGTLLIGTWLNTTLFAFELTQVYRYFVRYPLFLPRKSASTNGRRSDRAWIRVMVLWMVSLDILATVATCYLAYAYTVTGWGDISSLLARNSTLTTMIYTISTALSILTMHLFLISRYYTFSHYTVLSTVLVLLTCSACALAIVISIWIPTVNGYVKDTRKLRTLVILALSDSAATDWLIAGSLTWLLIRIRKTIDDKQRVITRLIRISFLSGSAPAALALICLIGFVSSPTTNFSLMFSLIFGRSASLTVLYNLNLRGTYSDYTHGASETDSTMHADTTAEIGGLFRRTMEGRSPGLTGDELPTGPPRVSRRSGPTTVVQSASIGVDTGLNSKPAVNLEAAVDRAVVRISLTTSEPPCLETTSRDTEAKGEL